MSVLPGAELRRLIFHTEDEAHRLIITPILDPGDQLNDRQASVDLRLGNIFVVQRRSEIARLNPWDPTSQDDEDELFLEEEIYVPFGRPFVLHPNQFVLACTLEYVALPSNLTAYVVGRSSWGRVGLIVVTASGIHPGYRGVITLELRNLAEVPLFIHPGARICQAFFHRVEPAAQTSTTLGGAYHASTKPEFARIRLPKKDQEALTRLGAKLGASSIRPKLK